MRTTLAALGLAAAMSVACWIGAASAAPAGAIAPQARTAANQPLQPAQFRARRTRHGIVKCYRTLVIGPYRCHYYRRHWW